MSTALIGASPNSVWSPCSCDSKLLICGPYAFLQLRGHRPLLGIGFGIMKGGLIVVERLSDESESRLA